MDLTDNIIAYWKLDGNSTDSVSTNNGTDTAISYVAGKINQAASFNGTTSTIDCGDDVSLKPAAVTVSVWAKYTTTDTNINLVAKASANTGGHSAYSVGVNQDVVGDVAFRIETSSGVYSDLSTGNLNLNDDAYHHFVGTYDNGTQILYVDGAVDQTGGSGTVINYDTDLPLHIGSERATVGFFTGIIDEVGVWDRALTGAEVTELYNAGVGLQYPFGDVNTGNFFLFF